MQIKPTNLYTKIDGPLMTKEGIRFYLEYVNDSDEKVESVPAEVIMGNVVRNVMLPGISPGEKKTVEMILTNNISDNNLSVGVRLGADPVHEIMREFLWIGKVDLGISDLKRFDEMDSEKEKFYRIFLQNNGTKIAKRIKVVIEKDNVVYGQVEIKELRPKSVMPINVGFDKKQGGLFKITLTAKPMHKSLESVSKSFHVELTSDQEAQNAGQKIT